ncbi:alpha/beta fold hydrolase [Arenibaculum pallidiluteum]|uniref:alpha/beta fold hydrolase n=1 Tax=Arenibaculum pallidiluteum TaxID=2812559 RepID=UPI001A96B13C|nr:alpha/beta hydrolase [Arenibaculum pallidiluteum]
MDMDGTAGVAAGIFVDGIECAADLPLPPRLSRPEPEFGRLDLPDGGWLRHAAWPAPRAPRGTVVLLGGRTEFIEKYEPIALALVARGWRTLSVDWRGQGGSSRFLPDSMRGHAPDFAVLEEDLAAYLDRIVRPRHSGGPLVLLGHSMGGHLALRLLAAQPEAADAAILSAPMAEISLGPFPPRLARWLARLAVRLGFGSAWAPGQRPYDPAAKFFRDNPVTTDRACWALHHLWMRARPELALGGVTYGWLDAAFRSMDGLARPEVAGRTRVPLLVLAAGRDTVVPADAQRRLATLHPCCRVVMLDDAMHEVLLERPEIRARAWAPIDAFLAEVAARHAAGAREIAGTR